MASTPAPSKLTRSVPFTPKRPLSSASSSELPSAIKTSVLGSTAKKFKATLSSESRLRTTVATKSSLTAVPATPAKKSFEGARPRTPGTPRSQTPTSHINTSDMDVSRIDPEDVLVDYQTVEPGDVSADIDDSAIPGPNYGKEDKVLVSIRIRPTTSAVSAHPAWDHSTQRTIKLFPQYAKSTATTPPEFHFDEVLTGSENRPVYNAVARSHVCAAMDGYNSVIFAYGQTASGKTFTLSGNEDQPGIIPRAMKDVFAYIRRTPTREYLLRCSYLEIYNETIYDLLAPPSMSAAQPVQIQGSGILVPLREEVVTSLKSVKEVLERGERNRRTASTDWNERSSRSHSVFRLVVESRERGEGRSETPNGRQTPGLRPPTPGGTRLQTIGGRSVQTSVLSLIDLAGSEKATSDKERTREGKYINTSLLTLGSVIGTLADNAAKNKNDHVPYRNSKLTRLLQPSLSGDARISVICTINPDANAVAESTSTLLFAQRIKRVQLSAKKKEIVDTDALIERYRKEIEDLKTKLSERQAEAPPRNRRLSAREQIDESKAMKDLNSRIQQLTKLILTSQTVDESKGDESRPASPSKVDFDMSPYQLQQELLATRLQLESQSSQILSLEAALLARPELPPDASETEKDKLIAEQAKTIRELEIVVCGYEDNLGEPLRAVREDVEKEWVAKLEEEMKKREDKEAWAAELVRQLEKEKKSRIKLEEERRALAAFVSKFDSLGLGLSSSALPSKLKPPKPMPGGASAAFAERQQSRAANMAPAIIEDAECSPVRVDFSNMKAQPSLLDQMPEEEWCFMDDMSFEMESVRHKSGLKRSESPDKAILSSKENIPL
ncbi:P-loop containing nucleoside triphosphate hydrolase protein [Suillus paluster]|uniref:P-loop containing nucleoside triphosphate hydrolase protein n=1 Tax=Suillus paluster TaxID=48578 RepID=UPI001B87C084|nr:P-loop containing nucleoside triphosphate hydrolase protein [Suillus paluster]KAG1732442.1 P-loop containing nucleoside triphosphate hydrolase protein [Suillus paluster]